LISILVWWSRRNEKSEINCDVDFQNENPSHEGKICGKTIEKLLSIANIL